VGRWVGIQITGKLTGVISGRGGGGGGVTYIFIFWWVTPTFLSFPTSQLFVLFVGSCLAEFPFSCLEKCLFFLALAVITCLRS